MTTNRWSMSNLSRAASALIVLTLGWAVLAPRAGIATPSSSTTQQASSEGSASVASRHWSDAGRATPVIAGKATVEGKNPNVHETRGRVPVPTRAPIHSGASKTNPTRALVNNRPRVVSGTARNAEPLRSGNLGNVERPRPVSIESWHAAEPQRMVSAVRPTAPLHNTVPHRSPNPAVVSGSANIHGGQTGAISGTGMVRRP